MPDTQRPEAGDDMSPNSALYWLDRIGADPRLRPLIPRTERVPYDHNAMVCALEGGDYPRWSFVVRDVKEAAGLIGYPAFVRTDLASAKHAGPSAYKAERAADLNRILCRTAEDNEMKFWMSPETPCAFLVRQFLELEAPFTAFGGLPIAREWRFFATPSDILCAHPYWIDSLRSDWVAGVVEQPHLPNKIEAALHRFGWDGSSLAHTDTAPSVFHGARLARSAVLEFNDLFLHLYQNLGLPALQPKVGQQLPRGIGCARCAYSAKEKRLTVSASGRNDAGISAESAVQQKNGFTLNLLDLNHGSEAGAGFSWSHVDGKAPVRVEDAGEVSQEGWAVFHILYDTPVTGEHTIGFCFLPDGDIIHEPNTLNWRELLADLHAQPPPDDWMLLRQAAMRAAEVCPAAPAWSVDFARDTSGRWWLIDMAVAEQSWHWPSCDRATQATRA